VDGYQDFAGAFVDTDAGIYAFSYELPKQLTADEALSLLRSRLPQYVVSRSADGLILRRSGEDAESFDEYHFRVERKRHTRILVLVASIDSPSEARHYPGFIEKYRSGTWFSR
jgi:hypothetical protein